MIVAKIQAAGAAAGAVLGALAGAALGAPGGPLAAATAAVGAAQGAAVGAMLGKAAGKAFGPKRKREETEQHIKTASQSHSEGTSWSELNQWSAEESSRHVTEAVRQVSARRFSKEAKALESLMDHHIDRLQQAKGVGMWRVSVHVSTRARPHLPVACNVLLGALRGDHSHIEPLRSIEYSTLEQANQSLAGHA